MLYNLYNVIVIYSLEKDQKIGRNEIILFQKSKSFLLGQQDNFARLTNEFC